jgi:Flp pilus assembly protein TadD
MKPAHPGIFYHLGILYDELGRRKQAADALTAALALNQDFPEAAAAHERLRSLRATS